MHRPCLQGVCVSVFEGEEGMRVWFSVPKKFQDSLFVSYDSVVSAVRPVCIGSDIQIRSSESKIVISVLAEDCRQSIELRDVSNELIAQVTPLEMQGIIQRRDSSIVNPTIDGLYHQWLQHHPVVAPHLAQNILNKGPLFTFVVPLYHTPATYFEEMLDSLLNQTYKRFEIVLVNASPEDECLTQLLGELNDQRIRVVTLEKNLGIAENTNAGIAAARGDYVAFVDHDDVVSPYLLAWYADAVTRDPQIDLLYCDEDNFCSLDEGFFAPRFKPEPNIDLLCSFNFFVHCLCVSRRALELTERSSAATDGAQDYDLTLKTLEVARSVCHVPKILYHWRQHEGSTNGGCVEQKPYAIKASIDVLEAYWKRRGIDALVQTTSEPGVFSTTYPVSNDTSISCVVPLSAAKDAQAFLDQASSWLPHNAEIIFVGSKAAMDDEELQGLSKASVRALSCPSAKWASLVDRGCKAAAGELVLVCDPTSRFSSAKDLYRLAGYLSRPEVGVVAPRVLLRDGLVGQTAQVVSSEGRIVSIDQGLTATGGGGYLGLAQVDAQCSALAPTVFLMRTDRYRALRGLPKVVLSPRYAMADLCFQLRSLGYACVSAASVSCEALVNFSLALQPENPSEYAGRCWLWRHWDTGWRKDILACEGVSFDGGYPHLNIDWINDAKTNKGMEQLKKIVKYLVRPDRRNLWFS